MFRGIASAAVGGAVCSAGACGGCVKLEPHLADRMPPQSAAQDAAMDRR